MPEGPEIHREAAALSDALVGETAICVWFAFEALTPWNDRLEGRRVVAVEARGKAIVIRFEAEDGEPAPCVYSHNQLYGRWQVVEAGARPATTRQLRLSIDTLGASALLYSASDIEVLRFTDIEAHPYIARLGPDVVVATTSKETVRRRLDDPRFQRRGLAGLLLDQGFFAGLGNYLRSEILFVAGIDPSRRLGQLAAAEKDRLAEALVALPRRSLRTRGITLAEDERPPAARGRRERFYVFGRQGRRCRRCKDAIERHEMAGRRLYLCPDCQRAGV
ncbi:MAG: endonuclease VIII [Acidobacteriota bacterium]